MRTRQELVDGIRERASSMDAETLAGWIKMLPAGVVEGARLFCGKESMEDVRLSQDMIYHGVSPAYELVRFSEELEGNTHGGN